MMASGAHPEFQVRGDALKRKLRRAEGGAKMFGVFRVKNHDFTPKYHIFFNHGGRRENFWGISCKKSRFYAKNSYFFQFWGGRAPGAPPRSAPGLGNQAFTKPVEWAVMVLWVSICLYFYDFSTGFWKRSDGMVRYYLFFHLNFNFNMFMKFNASILLKYCQRRH